MITFHLKTPRSTPGYLYGTYFSSLDGFRAISIVFVLIGHSYHDIFPFVTGSFGVQVFFVISGFLITKLLLRERQKTGSINLKKFYIRRFLRIFPVAYLFLLVVFLIGLILNVSIEKGEFFSSLLYIRNTSIINVEGNYTGHYWSLSLEEQFYLFCPFLIALCVRKYTAILLVLLALLPGINYVSFHYINDIPVLYHISEIIRGFTPILVGSLFGILNFKGIVQVNISSRYKTIASIAIFLLGSYIHTKFLPFGNTFLILSSLPIAILLLINIEPDDNKYNVFYRFLNNYYVRKLGVYSYSIYIWQQIFTLYKPWHHLGPIANNQIINTIALMVVSFLSYYYYERWFLKLKDRFA